jgi:hypothetical protein
MEAGEKVDGESLVSGNRISCAKRWKPGTRRLPNGWFVNTLNMKDHVERYVKMN